MAESIVYVDHPVDGVPDATGRLPVLEGQLALENALTQWLLSCPNDFIRSDKGGYIVPLLDKPMSEDTAEAIRSSLLLGLRTDFSPSITVSRVSARIDLEQDCWVIEIVGYCPDLKSLVNYSRAVRRIS